MDNKTEYDDHFQEAAQALFDSLSTEQQHRARLIGKMQASYIETTRDKQLNEAFDGLLENASAALFGKAGKRRALFVVGESGSGKTTSLERQISKRKQFEKRVTSDGEEVSPLVYFEAPKPLTLKGLARAGLKALGYEFEGRADGEQELFETWKTQIRESRALYLWIDEFQHVLRGNTTREIQNVADIVKSLTQIPGWPLHIILSGVPALAQFLHQSGSSDGQLTERSFIVELRALSVPEDLANVRTIIRKIITKDAKLNVEGLDTDEFAHRLVHAANGAFGSTIQMVRSACEFALRAGKPAVNNECFVATYALISGCRPTQNVFSSDQWRMIVPKNSLGELLARAARLETQPEPKARPSTRRKK